MSRLLLPPKVVAEIVKDKHAEERARRRALTERLLDFDDPVCREWQPTLTRLDPGLRLGRARPQAYEPDMNVRPGFYHWVRDNGPLTPFTIEPVTGPDDGFVEPDESLLRQLRANDLQNPQVMRAVVAARAKAELDEERGRQEAHERRVAGTVERYRSMEDVSVSMADGWSNTVKGRKR